MQRELFNNMFGSSLDTGPLRGCRDADEFDTPVPNNGLLLNGLCIRTAEHINLTLGNIIVRYFVRFNNSYCTCPLR